MYEHIEIHKAAFEIMKIAKELMHPNQIEKLYYEIVKLGEPSDVDAYRKAEGKELVAFLLKIFELNELAFQIYWDADNLDSRKRNK
jgi:hypothetical protein